MFEKAENSASQVDELCKVLAAEAIYHGGTADDSLFRNTDEMHEFIDSIQDGEVSWGSFTVRYTGTTASTSPSWMHADYIVHCRDTLAVVETMAASEDFQDSFHYAPFEETTATQSRRWCDLMSGRWAWKQAVCAFLLA